MLIKSQIIVLNTIKYGDNGAVIQCYSDTGGRISVFMRSAGKSKNGNAYLHRLSILDVELFVKGDGMPLIKEFTPATKLDTLRTNIYKSAIAIFISELILKSVREVEPNPKLYSFLRDIIISLDNCDSGAANFPAYFMVSFCKEAGFMPYDNYSDNTPLFNMESASFVPFGFVSENIGIGKENHFSLEESMLLHAFLNIRPDGLQAIALNGNTRYAFAKQMVRYLSLHMGYNIELKSMEVLHELR